MSLNSKKTVHRLIVRVYL